MLNKELSHFSESKSGNQISEYICNTFLGKLLIFSCRTKVLKRDFKISSTFWVPPPPKSAPKNGKKNLLHVSKMPFKKLQNFVFAVHSAHPKLIRSKHSTFNAFDAFDV